MGIRSVAMAFAGSVVLGAAAIWVTSTSPDIPYCQVFEGTLLDTSAECTSAPDVERAFGAEGFEWRGHQYLIMNTGNQLTLYNIDVPTVPVVEATSNYNFDSTEDYELLTVDVCDECRYGSFLHQTEGVVLFDFGAGTLPAFRNHGVYQGAEGHMVFMHGDMFYVIMARVNECSGASGLYQINTTSNIDLLQCIERDSVGYKVHAGQSLHIGDDTYLYLGDMDDGSTTIYQVDDSNPEIALIQVDYLEDMKSWGHALSIDDYNLLAASADSENVGGLVTLWDLEDPAHPIEMFGIQHPSVSTVSLRSPGGDSPAMLTVVTGGDENSAAAYIIRRSGAHPLPNAYWSDENEGHNDAQECVTDMDGALNPNGTVFYWNRYSLSQVFDITECYALDVPTPTPTIFVPTATMTPGVGTPTAVPTNTPTPAPPTPTPTPTRPIIVIPWSEAQIILSEMNPNYSLDQGLGYMNVTITNNYDYTVEIVRTYWDWGDQQVPGAWVDWMGLCYDGTENYCDFDEYYWQSQPGTAIWLPSPCPPTPFVPPTHTPTFTPSNTPTVTNTPIPPTPTPPV